MQELIALLEQAADKSYELADKATQPFDRIQHEAIGGLLLAQARQYRRAV